MKTAARPAERSNRRENHPLKGAPVPVARDTGSDIRGLAEVGLEGSAAGLLAVLHVLRVGALVDAAGVDVVLDLVQTVGAGLLPARVGAPAKVASTRGNTVGVEASLLVEGNVVGSVGGAENMTAVTAVVATQKDAERRATGRGITVRRSSVGL